MLRFHEGEQVLVHRVRDEKMDPVAFGTVTKVYAPGESFLLNYVVEIAGRRITVKDAWLDPYEILIPEDTEYSDL